MATLALALGTSHSGHLNVPLAHWGEFAEKDKTDPRVGDFEELSRQKASWIGPELTPEKWRERHDRVQAAIGRLGEILRMANVDAVVTVGDDQHELYTVNMMPALGVYWGEFIDTPRARDTPDLNAWQKAIMDGYASNMGDCLPGEPGLGEHIVTSLTASGFQPTQTRLTVDGARVGHAFQFIYRRLMGDHVVPQVPVLLNSYYPPNQPSTARCYELGEALREAIESWPENRRIALIASGGLSHFVVDESIDRTLIAALEHKDKDALTGFPDEALVQGTTEIKMWVTVGGAMADSNHSFSLLEYQPLYRTTAGSGVGACFGVWEEENGRHQP